MTKKISKTLADITLKVNIAQDTKGYPQRKEVTVFPEDPQELERFKEALEKAVKINKQESTVDRKGVTFVILSEENPEYIFD